MGLVYSYSKSDMNLEGNKDKISMDDDDFVKIKKPELPTAFLNNYLAKKHLPIIYESSEENESDKYDVDLLDTDEKIMLDDVFGI